MGVGFRCHTKLKAMAKKYDKKKKEVGKSKNVSPLKLDDNFETAKSKLKLKNAIDKSNKDYSGDDYFESPRLRKNKHLSFGSDKDSDEDSNLDDNLKKQLNSKVPR